MPKKKLVGSSTVTSDPKLLENARVEGKTITDFKPREPRRFSAGGKQLTAEEFEVKKGEAGLQKQGLPIPGFWPVSPA